MDNLTNLDLLYLGENQITEIKGLKKLKNLQYLTLTNNQIEEIKGLENLSNLEYLELRGNPIKDEEKHLVGKTAQEVVKYCQEKARNAKK